MRGKTALLSLPGRDRLLLHYNTAVTLLFFLLLLTAIGTPKCQVEVTSFIPSTGSHSFATFAKLILLLKSVIVPLRDQVNNTVGRIRSHDARLW